jgi:hypothetical protein
VTSLIITADEKFGSHLAAAKNGEVERHYASAGTEA